MYHPLAAAAIARFRETTTFHRHKSTTGHRRVLPRLPGPHVYRLDLEPLPGTPRGHLLCPVVAGQELTAVARRWYGDEDLAPDLAALNGIRGSRVRCGQMLRVPLLPEHSIPLDLVVAVA